MAKYIKKPIIVEAEQWQGSAESWDKIMSMGLRDWSPGEMGSKTFYIKTLSGEIKVCIDDYVIKGIKGEIYPCKPEIFKSTYEAIKVNKSEVI